VRDARLLIVSKIGRFEIVDEWTRNMHDQEIRGTRRFKSVPAYRQEDKLLAAISSKCMQQNF
jgi:hypothetical protein